MGNWGGLDRFDRETGIFAHYLHDEKDDDSLGHNAVRGIREDAQGCLWIATTFGGINRLDPKTGRFARYVKGPDNPGSLSDNNVWRLFIDGGGTLWAGASQALNRFDPKTETFVHYRHDPKVPNSIGDNLVINMHEDRDGVLWLATPAGLGYVFHVTVVGDAEHACRFADGDGGEDFVLFKPSFQLELRLDHGQCHCFDNLLRRGILAGIEAHRQNYVFCFDPLGHCEGDFPGDPLFGLDGICLRGSCSKGSF